jgi:hypothetical protein
MIQLIIIPVIPKPTNPYYWTEQAGWLMAYVRPEVPHKIQFLEAYLQHHQWAPTETRYVRVFTAEDQHTIPSDVLAALEVEPIHAQLNTYQVGGGPEIPPALFVEYDEGQHGQ